MESEDMLKVCFGIEIESGIGKFEGSSGLSMPSDSLVHHAGSALVKCLRVLETHLNSDEWETFLYGINEALHTAAVEDRAVNEMYQRQIDRDLESEED